MSQDDRDSVGKPDEPSDDDARAIVTRLSAGETPGKVVGALASDAFGRRWLRERVLPALDEEPAAGLALWLLGWPGDFRAGHRDRTTAHVVRRLPSAQLLGHAGTLAGSNAASTFWERVVALGPEVVEETALRVLTDADAGTRATTLHTLLLDPYGPIRLPDDVERRLLQAAIADTDDEVRGLAAELAMEIAPDLLLDDPDRRATDGSERLRAAYWSAAFAHRFDEAVEQATTLVTDESTRSGARRSALAALGETLRTRQVAPLLAEIVAHPDPVLAGDAADLMWRLHRNPAIAQAAAESPHAPVREIANRLLHPEIGSPAAGGSRPGDPTKTTDIYEQMLRQISGQPDDDSHERE